MSCPPLGLLFGLNFTLGVAHSVMANYCLFPPVPPPPCSRCCAPPPPARSGSGCSPDRDLAMGLAFGFRSASAPSFLLSCCFWLSLAAVASHLSRLVSCAPSCLVFSWPLLSPYRLCLIHFPFTCFVELRSLGLSSFRYSLGVALQVGCCRGLRDRYARVVCQRVPP